METFYMKSTIITSRYDKQDFMALMAGVPAERLHDRRRNSRSRTLRNELRACPADSAYIAAPVHVGLGRTNRQQTLKAGHWSIKLILETLRLWFGLTNRGESTETANAR